MHMVMKIIEVADLQIGRLIKPLRPLALVYGVIALLLPLISNLVGTIWQIPSRTPTLLFGFWEGTTVPNTVSE